MSEDRERLSVNEDAEQTDDDVEAHRLERMPSISEDDEDGNDDVEAHRLA